jgi:hypothetical protein
VAEGQVFEPLDVAKVSPFIVENHEAAGFQLILWGFYLIRSFVRIFSTNLAQHFGVNPSVETPELAHSCWLDVLFHTLYSLGFRICCWLKNCMVAALEGLTGATACSNSSGGR